jgi:hypothetical protein
MPNPGKDIDETGEGVPGNCPTVYLFLPALFAYLSFCMS